LALSRRSIHVGANYNMLHAIGQVIRYDSLPQMDGAHCKNSIVHNADHWVIISTQVRSHADAGVDVSCQVKTVTICPVGKGKSFPYSLPSVGPGADPGVHQAVTPQVTISHQPCGRLPLLSARPAVTFPAAEHHLGRYEVILLGDKGT